MRHKTPMGEAEIKIPDSLVKVADLKETYEELQKIQNYVAGHKRFEEKKKQMADLLQEELTGSMYTMELISLV